jgi:hypothetical protein
LKAEGLFEERGWRAGSREWEGHTGSDWESGRRIQLAETSDIVDGKEGYGGGRTSNELEGLGDIASELLGVGHFNFRHGGWK